MTEVTPYLYFPGTCEEAMRFYADVFGARVVGIFRNGDAAPDQRMPGPDHLVMNAALDLGGRQIMASDAPADWYRTPQGFDIALEAGSAEHARQWFTRLSEGGKVKMPISETFWAELFGSLEDRYGVPWMVSFTGAKRMADQG